MKNLELSGRARDGSGSAELLKISVAAERLGGVSPWTLRKHVSRGNIAVVRIGRLVFIPTSELTRLGREGLPSLGSGDEMVDVNEI